jgi:zona occludens toxin
MITLITGGPGLGKTAHAVDTLQKLYSDRPVFSNVRGLKLDHSAIPKIEDWTVEVSNQQGTSEHQFTFPPGAVILIDECQQFFRPRASGSRVPPYVQAFETHRHRGIDFVLVTQGTHLVDHNLKALIKGGKHVHLRTTWLGRYSYEASEMIDADSKASLAQCSKRRYKLPSHVFDLYKSAELHTKPPRPRLPMQAYVLAAVLIGGSALAYSIGGKINDKIQPGITGQNLSADPQASGDAQRRTLAQGVAVVVPLRIQEALTPTDDHNPLSAPLYAAVVPSVTAPEVVGCISSRQACTCFSQQSTPVWLPDEQCRQRAAGQYFDPYRSAPALESKTRPMPIDAQEAPEARQGSGNSLPSPA